MNRFIAQNFTQAPWNPKKDLKLRLWWNILMNLTTRNFYPMVLQLNACNEMHTWPSHLRHEEKCNECLPMYFWFCPIELIWQFSLFEILFKITKNNVRQKKLFFTNDNKMQTSEIEILKQFLIFYQVATIISYYEYIG